jgi:hypothetical protein
MQQRLAAAPIVAARAAQARQGARRVWCLWVFHPRVGRRRTFHVLRDQQRVAGLPDAGAVELHNVAVVVQPLEDAHFLQVVETPGFLLGGSRQSDRASHPRLYLPRPCMLPSKQVDTQGLARGHRTGPTI